MQQVNNNSKKKAEPETKKNPGAQTGALREQAHEVFEKAREVVKEVARKVEDKIEKAL